MKIVNQIESLEFPKPLRTIFVLVGGGGLIAGISAYVKQVCPEVKIIGVEPTDANAMAVSLHHGQRVMLNKVGGFADGVAVKVVGEETFRLCRELIDGVVLVSRDAICASIKATLGIGTATKTSFVQLYSPLACLDQYCKTFFCDLVYMEVEIRRLTWLENHLYDLGNVSPTLLPKAAEQE